MARSGDPMSGLLSGLGGIDPTLFQRPQAMKDMKGGTPQRPADFSRPADSSAFRAVSQPNQQASNNLASRPIGQARPASDVQAKPVLGSSPNKTAFADKDFSSLLGDNNFAKGGRPMRQTAKAAPAPTTNTDWTIDTQSAKSEALSEASLLSPAASLTAQQSATALPKAADPFQSSPQPDAARMQPSATLSDANPFDFFGGPQQSRTCQSQESAHADLLQGFGDVQGATSHIHGAGQAPAAPLPASSSGAFFDFAPLPEHSSTSKAAANAAPQPGHVPASSRPGMQPASSTYTSSSPPNSRQAAEPTASTPASTPSRPAYQPVQPRPQASSRPALQPEPQAQTGAPPSYQEAISRQPLPVGSPEQGHRRVDDWQRPPLGGARDRRQPPVAATATDDGYGYDVEPLPRLVSQGSRQRPDQGLDVDGMQPQVPAWLANSQKWLKSAGKKVAQAAKETTAQLQARLEEFEGRPARGGAERANSYGADGAPEYFQDWATRIEAMPSDRAASMLEAMSEQDRLKVQRIMDEHAMEHSRAKAASPRSTGPLSARSRRSEAVSRSGTALSSLQSYPDSPRSFEEDSQQAEAVSRDLHAALSSPRKSMQRKDSDVLSNASSSQPESRVTSRKALDPGNAPGSPQSSPTRLAPSSPPFAQHSAPQAAQPEYPSADFLGFSDSAQSGPAPDLMSLDNGFQPEDMFTLPSQAGPQQRQQQTLARAAAEDLDIFASPKAARPAPSSQSQSPADVFTQPPARPSATAARGQAAARPAAAAAAAMMDFRNEGAPAAAAIAAAGDQDIEGEPELRRELRAQRLARTQARMQEQLAEKQARDAKEEADRSNKGDLRTTVRPRMDAWQAGKKDNIRALLASLDTVLWEGSGWAKPGMADLVDKGRVKRAYMRANLIVHPDKVAQKGGTLEQVVIADMAFDALKTAWAKFEAGELRS